MRSIHEFDVPPLEIAHSKELKQVQQAGWLQQLIWKLEHPINGSVLGLFRVLFSVVLIFYLISLGELVFHLEESHAVLHYSGIFHVWPTPPEVTGMLVALALVFSLMLLVGLLTRLASFVCLCSLSYLFLICQGNYSHHGVFCCYVLLLGSVVDWACWMSVDNVIFRASRRRTPTIPRWHLYSMQFTVLVPITFSCLYKLSPDWLLRAQPAEFDSPIFDSPFLALITAWIMTGCEILIVLVLVSPSPRYPFTLPAAAMYHALHVVLEEGGFMALATLLSLSLFMEPYQPATYFKRMKQQIHWFGRLAERLKVVRPRDKTSSPVSTPRQGPTITVRPQQILLLLCLALMASFQILVPLRGCIQYKCRAAWMGHGYFASWVMPPNKEGWLYVVVQDRQGRVLELIPTADPFLAVHQRTAVLLHPSALQVYLQRLAQLFHKSGRPLQSMHVHSCISLNGREDRELYDNQFNVVGGQQDAPDAASVTGERGGLKTGRKEGKARAGGRRMLWQAQFWEHGNWLVMHMTRSLYMVLRIAWRGREDRGTLQGDSAPMMLVGNRGLEHANISNEGERQEAALKVVELKMHTWQDAPACEDKLTLEERPGMTRRSQEAYQDLFRAAGMFAQVRTDDEDLQRQTVRHRAPASPGSTSQMEWGYMWELAGY